MPRYWKRKILLAKTEVTYGVDSVPTAAANAMQAIDLKLSPMEGQDLDRELERATFGAEPTLPVDLHMKLGFRIELSGSGTAGTAPAWGPLLRACGMAQTIAPATSVTFNPITSGQESVTIYLHIDGQLYAMRGTRGTAKLTFGASAIPYLEFEMTGLFTQPTDVAMPASPDVSAFRDPVPGSRANTPVFTVNSVAMVMRSLSFDLGNAVEPRFLIGVEEILITDKAEKVEFVVEQPSLATINPFALAAGGTRIPVVLNHGTVAGNRVALNLPNTQLMRPGAPENRQGVIEQTLRGTPLPGTAGNDQFTLVLT